MTLQKVNELVSELPYRFREDILSYARSVQYALPDIFLKAHVNWNENLAEQVIYIAGLKKFHSICSSVFWTLENSLHMLEHSDVSTVRIGSTHYHKQSEEYVELSTLINNLEDLLYEHRIFEFIQLRSYTEILERLHQ